ncbi:hypothetical protein Cs7R123_32270 [Catellatospora sp. TT07R-123]|uniref:MobF family relaxase n=1 Tax=Catellatospora sp. TT07R-123 TaxID=2733863 RepID=UPI001B01E0DA|nr:MobF family relaxase [Catellatospora sp. TT07R-123]GHJ45885.1 hypothetical protein Cs7R123_32270 [Catellatospora sp. TT07R-123]
MMSLAKLSVGDGYTYLTRHIAGGDCDRIPGQSAAEYYTANGNPPGQWGGRGLPALGLSGTVTEQQMTHLYGQGMHPDSDRIMADYLARHMREEMTDKQRAALTQKAIRHATLGRRFPVYKNLDAFDSRVNARFDVIRTEAGREPNRAEIAKIRAEEAGRSRGGVAGFDLVFTPVKSLVVLGMLDERQWVRDAAMRVHVEARDSALAFLEEHAAYTRTGDSGQVHLATRGLIYSVFDHFDNRNGDPNLHTHVTVSAKIQGVDDKWRSLNGRLLYNLAVAASEHYNSAVETLAARYLGVGFEVRPDTVRKRHVVREIAGMPLEVIKTFSSRRAQVEAEYDQLIVDYRRAHGRDPDKEVAFALAERANLATRGPKPAPRSLAGLRAGWRDRLTNDHGRKAIKKVMAVVPATTPGRVSTAVFTELSTGDISALAQLTAGRTAMSRSTWTVWNLRAEADRTLRQPPDGMFPDGLVFATVEQRTAVLEQVVAQAVEQHSIPVTAHHDLPEPAMLRRVDGTSVFVEHGSTRFTSQAILDAEQRLLAAATTPGARTAELAFVTAVLDGYEAVHGKTLDAGQRAMVVEFATNPNMITVGLGPAGAGKTTTMHAYQHVLAANGQRLIPLATSAAAAAVLANDLGVAAENLHKMVIEHMVHGQPDPQRAGRDYAKRAFFRVEPGDVILVDEAGLAGTRNLDTLLDIAARHGASVRLLGDYRQLSAVESGGALRLLATEVGAVELTELHRFTTPQEADNTRRLREGDTAALDYYAAGGRIRGGSAEAMIEQAYNGWHADMTAGLRTIMSSSTTSGVTALSARARTDRVAAGQVDRDGVQLHDGNLVGTGDWIVTRVNDRRMTCNRGKDWVRNGDAWTVTKRHRNGSLKVQHQRHGGTLTLPADYVTAHVELMYATTTHRAQGSTVDTAHALVTDDMSRENLYVAATRARIRTILYAVTHQILPLDEDARLDRSIYDPYHQAAREVLENVLAREGTQLSATQTIAAEQEHARSLAAILPRMRYAADLATQDRMRELVVQAFGEHATTMRTDESWSSVVRALRSVEAQGWDLSQVLAGAARRGPLPTDEDPSKVLAWRIRDHVDGRTPTPAMAQPTTADAARYAALLHPILPQQLGLDPHAAVGRPRALRTDITIAQADNQKSLAAVLGDHDARRATDEAAWPALTAAVRRAENAGYDPARVLTAAVLQRPLHDADSISQVLAWRITHTLDTRPTPAEDSNSDTWRTLAWTLKAAETNGTPAGQLLAASKPGTSLDGLLQHVQTLTAPAPAAGVLPWLAPNPATTNTDLTDYLTHAEQLAAARVEHLALTALAGQPAWLAGLGTTPTSATAHATWMGHVGVVAAYRDQHQITTDDPTQPLGAYVPADRAEHDAYLHAADAVLATRHPGLPRLDTITARITADIYLALPEAERDAISTDLAARLGGDWLGPRGGDADTLLTAPAYTAHLHAVLVHCGHLTASEPHTSSIPQPRTEPPLVRNPLTLEAPMEYTQPSPGTEITW